MEETVIELAVPLVALLDVAEDAVVELAVELLRVEELAVRLVDETLGSGVVVLVDEDIVDELVLAVVVVVVVVVLAVLVLVLALVKLVLVLVVVVVVVVVMVDVDDIDVVGRGSAELELVAVVHVLLLLLLLLLPDALSLAGAAALEVGRADDDRHSKSATYAARVSMSTLFASALENPVWNPYPAVVQLSTTLPQRCWITGPPKCPANHSAEILYTPPLLPQSPEKSAT